MDMVKFHAASACLILVCLLMNLQPLLADGDAVETASTDSAAAEISAKLKQSEDRDEVARLKAEPGRRRWTGLGPASLSAG